MKIIECHIWEHYTNRIYIYSVSFYNLLPDLEFPGGGVRLYHVTRKRTPQSGSKSRHIEDSLIKIP
jgi:hypothetical protein